MNTLTTLKIAANTLEELIAINERDKKNGCINTEFKNEMQKISDALPNNIWWGFFIQPSQY